MKYAALAGLLVATLIAALVPMPHLFTSLDKAAHVVAFATLTWAARRAGLRAWLVVLLLAPLAPLIEIAQAMLPMMRRSASVSDCVVSLLGLGIGFLAPVRVNWRGGAISVAALIGIALGTQAAFTAARPHIVGMLVRDAWQRGSRVGIPQAPWAAAPAHIAYRLDMNGASAMLGNSADMPALAIAPGLWPGSAAPGQGFSIFMGHRNRAFRALGALPVGAPLAITDIKGRTTRYVVSSRAIVRWNRSGLRLNEPAGLALVTCWPVTETASSDLRLIVRARPLGPSA